MLEDMLIERKEEAELAVLHFELYLLTGEHLHRDTAKRSLERLYKKVPNASFKEMLKELDEK
jgi:hypothetical protein